MIRTKIVCTIGPASREPEMLRALIETGMDVARLNMSHADHEFHAETIRRIRKASVAAKKTVAILADLQGPKLRIGDIAGKGVEIEEGEHIVLTTRKIQGKRGGAGQGDTQISATIPIQYRDLPRDIKPGERILIDDGLIEVKVMGVSPQDIFCQVITGGVVTDNKGLNLPGTLLSIDPITEKDRADIEFAILNKVDWLALSFVRSAQEVIELKQYLKQRCRPTELIRLISKIEKPQALEVIDEIIAASDGIMIARGDLGIEIPTENVPMVQKRLIQLCNAATKPVITATQMLDSMIRNPRPTRAEASDVANAILDGTDAIMLSGETANGKYPLEAVQTMVNIASEVERVHLTGEWHSPRHVTTDPDEVTDAVSHSTCDTAYGLGATAIITATASGATARYVSKYRPYTPIIAATPNATVERQLRLSWGVIPVHSRRAANTDQIMRELMHLVEKKGFAKAGDRVVLTAGVATNMPGTTNLMMVEVIGKMMSKAR
jgi:pyruvate kinase